MASLKYKILFLTIASLALTLLIIGGLTVYNKVGTERELLLNRLNAYRILLESGDLAFETSADKVKLEALFNEKVEFSEIIGKDYTAIYSSESIASKIITEQDKRDIDDAFRGIETTKNIRSIDGKKAFAVISPLIVNNKVVAVLHQGISNEQSSQRVLKYAGYIAIFILIGLAACFIFISILLERVALKNIYKLQQATTDMQRGSLDAEIGIKASDEIGALATDFDLMRKAIKSQRNQLQSYSKDLEIKIKERTKQLESKNDELEQFNRIAVGRELKMVELKKEIAALKKKRQ